MFNNRLEMYGGFVAWFDEEKNVYVFNVPWLGRDIEVWLSSGDYEEDTEIEVLKKSFEEFWTNKEKYLNLAQNDIKETLLPYIATHDSGMAFLPYPKVSEDDFDAEYWLTSVYVVADSRMRELRFNFNKDDDDRHDGELSVTRDVDSGYLSFDAGLVPVNIK